MSTERRDEGTADTARGDRDATEGAGPRRRRSRLAVVSIAAAVLLAGGGGAYVAATAADEKVPTDPSAEGAPPPLALEGFAAGDQDGAAQGIAPGEPDPNGTRYHLTGTLPQGPDEAAVYRAESTVTSADVAKLAKALGITAAPQLTAGTWRAGAQDGPTLRVSQAAPGTWTYTAFAPRGGDNCARGKDCPANPPAKEGSRVGPVSEETALKAAAPVLKALGQDDAKTTASQLMGAVRVVNANPKVDGLPTHGWSTGIRVGSDGAVVGGSGRLVTPAKGDTYPVLSAEKTLDLLNKTHNHPMKPGGCAEPVPLGAGKQQAKCTTDGGQQGARPSEAAVQGAEFGLSTQSVAGRQTLVPSWLFQTRAEGATMTQTVPYPAVDPAYLHQGQGNQPGTGETAKQPRVTAYSADGRALTVRFWGGVCDEYTATADESDSKVTVSVRASRPDPDKTCVMIAKELTRKITLDAPLGSRTVTDSAGARLSSY